MQYHSDTFWWADKGQGTNKPLESWSIPASPYQEVLPANVCSLSTLSVVLNPDTRFLFVLSPKLEAHFVKNMFIRPSDGRAGRFQTRLYRYEISH
ncbi:hypothetical protein ACLBOM_05000 [Escherichia coli]